MTPPPRTDGAPHAFDDHDHAMCQSDALAVAERACADRGVRFTAVRRRVLEILLENHRAMGAYDVLERLNAEGLGSKPPVAYRALNFLVEQGLAHRIECLNAFVACTHGPSHHQPAFLICRSCARVAEAGVAPTDGLKAAASAAGFVIDGCVIEAQGLCADCAGSA